MTKHQIQIDEDVWAWAQEQTGQTIPASFLRKILVKTMYGTLDVQTPNVPVAQQESLRDRWRAIQLGRDPVDSQYMEYRKKFIEAFDSELEALESAERLYANGYDRDEHGHPCVSNMRGYLVYLVKRMDGTA